MKIIGIANQKGGTGKTTSAVNITAYLALAGKKTLLVDMDPQGNSSSGLGLTEEEVSSSANVYDALLDDDTDASAIRATKWDNLFLLPSSVALTGAEVELVSVEAREQRLKSFLKKWASDFDYVIIDAPPSLGILTLNVLVACDSLIVPIQCEYFALEGVSKILNTMSLIQDTLNPALALEGVLLTMADFRTRLSLQVIGEVQGYFKEKAFKTIIPRNVRLAEAPSFGQPICYYDIKSVGAKAYQKLVQEVIGEEIELDLPQEAEVRAEGGL